MTDPNWLYSSIVQSSAAIVAILGGFITASILNKANQRDDLKSQLDLKSSQLVRQNAEQARLTKELGLTPDETFITGDLEAKRSKIQDEISLLQARYEQSRTTTIEQRFAVGSVVFLAIVGIVVPLLLMPAETSATRLSMESLVVVGLFILGLMMFLALLVVQLLPRKESGG